MPALISSPGVYTANESCVYEGSRRLKNSITTLGFAWPAFHNPLPSLVRRPYAETTLPPARVEKGGKKRKKKKRRNFVLDISYTRTPLKPDETELFRVPIHLERLFIVPPRAESIQYRGKNLFSAIDVREKSVKRRGLTVRLSLNQSVDKR